MAGLAAILLPSPLPAQITFQRTYGGAGDDEAPSVRQTADGGYIVAGFTDSYGAGSNDVYLVKTDAAGYAAWTKTYGGSDYDVGTSVAQTADSGYLVTGYSSSLGAGNYDEYVIRTNARGDTLWTRALGGSGDDRGFSVQQTADGGCVVAGLTMSFGAGEGDVYLTRFAQNGDTVWTRTYGGADDDEGFSVQQVADGGFIVAGCTRSFGAGSYDVYLIRTDANGDSLWTRTYGTTHGDGGCAVQQTTDGGFIIAGWTLSLGAGDCDVYLVKTGADGGLLWARTYGGVAADDGYWVQQTDDGGYVVSGYTRSYGAGSEDAYLLKTDSLGNVAVAEPKASPTRAPALSLTCEPNPFRSSTVLHLTTGPLDPSTTLLRIYDAQGRIVRSFSSLLSPPSSLTWDGTNELGHPLPSGTYFIRLDAAGLHATARLVLQR
jgi:hypothetical protein